MKIRPIRDYKTKTDEVQNALKELYEILKQIESNDNYSAETKNKLYYLQMQSIRKVINTENILGLSKDKLSGEVFIFEYPIKCGKYIAYEQLWDEEGLCIEVEDNL